MANFLIRYHFDKDDYIEQRILADSEEQAGALAAAAIGWDRRNDIAHMEASHVTLRNEDDESLYLFPKDNVRYCKVLALDRVTGER